MSGIRRFIFRDQRKNKTLDIITGFQVLDGQYHMFVLEGLADKGIRRLWQNLPRPQEEGKGSGVGRVKN